MFFPCIEKRGGSKTSEWRELPGHEAQPEDHDNLKHTLGQASETRGTYEEAHEREQHAEAENETHQRTLAPESLFAPALCPDQRGAGKAAKANKCAQGVNPELK